jgi:hypothetical protein
LHFECVSIGSLTHPAGETSLLIPSQTAPLRPHSASGSWGLCPITIEERRGHQEISVVQTRHFATTQGAISSKGFREVNPRDADFTVYLDQWSEAQE